jgi:hypothetical protein
VRTPARKMGRTPARKTELTPYLEKTPNRIANTKGNKKDSIKYTSVVFEGDTLNEVF